MNEQSPLFGPGRVRVAGAMPRALSAGLSAALVAVAGDIVFALDAQGVVEGVAVSGSDLDGGLFLDMVGRVWTDCVTVESRPKVEEMLKTARAKHDGRWRQVNHPVEGPDIPARYLLLADPEGDGFVAIGRDLRALGSMQQRLLKAQQTVERDYLRLRQAEMRYRTLFDQSDEAVLIVEANTRKVREANSAAHLTLRAKPGALVGQSVSELIVSDQRDAFGGFFGMALAGEVSPRTFGLVTGGAEASIAVSAFVQDRSTFLLVRLGTESRPDTLAIAVRNVAERMPDAFVLTDASFRLLAANDAFTDLVHGISIERMRGEELSRWLGRSGVEFDLLALQLRDAGVLRNVSARMRLAGESEEAVEVSAVAVPGHFGFTIRSTARRAEPGTRIDPELPRSVDQLTQLVGRMSLKEIVRESTDLIERLCIEAALTHTADNRASAAEILGVSRQSLYSKLHRHGLGNLVGDDE